MTQEERVARYAAAVHDQPAVYVVAAVMAVADAEQAERDRRWESVLERAQAVEAQARELKGRVGDLVDECIRQKRRAIAAERALDRVEALCDQWAQKPDLLTSGASIQSFIRVAIEGPK